MTATLATFKAPASKAAKAAASNMAAKTRVSTETARGAMLAPSQAQVTALVNAQVKADASLYTMAANVARLSGPIGEARWAATIAPLFKVACAKVSNPAKRMAEFKLVMIGLSNGLVDASTPKNFTGYVKFAREECPKKGLITKTKKGPKARGEVTNGKGETVKAEVKESPKAISAQGAIGHAHALIGNLDIAAFLVRACETGNRDQLIKYLKATFPAPKE